MVYQWRGQAFLAKAKKTSTYRYLQILKVMKNQGEKPDEEKPLEVENFLLSGLTKGS